MRATVYIAVWAIAAVALVLDDPAGERLPTIAGSVPDLADLPAGCPFAGRCPRTMDACLDALPPAVALDADLGGGHMARCIRLGDAP